MPHVTLQCLHKEKRFKREDQLSLILENVMLDNCRNYDKGSYFNSRFEDRGLERAQWFLTEILLPLSGYLRTFMLMDFKKNLPPSNVNISNPFTLKFLRNINHQQRVGSEPDIHVSRTRHKLLQHHRQCHVFYDF